MQVTTLHVRPPVTGFCVSLLPGPLALQVSAPALPQPGFSLFHTWPSTANSFFGSQVGGPSPGRSSPVFRSLKEALWLFSLD